MMDDPGRSGSMPISSSPSFTLQTWKADLTTPSSLHAVFFTMPRREKNMRLPLGRASSMGSAYSTRSLAGASLTSLESGIPASLHLPSTMASTSIL